MDVHDLTAAYALDALEPAEADEYEAHLGQCEECRAQLAELNEAAGALAFGAVSPAPPAHLRESILAAAAAERSNVVPLFRHRRWTPRVLAVAAAAACVAVGFGISSLESSGTQVISAAVVLAPDRTATLHLGGLAAAPQGKTYEAWIIPAGGAPRPAGLFAGQTLSLRGKLPPHATVAVTLEPARGVSAPTTPVLIAAQT
jgi:anti-sigma-K factor RskA